MTTRPVSLLTVDEHGPLHEEGPLHSLETAGPNDVEKMVLRSYVDSGAARSVCPKEFAEHLGCAPSPGSLRGECFKTATNKRVPNLGTRTVVGVTDEGKKTSMSYAVAGISVPLDSVSQICDSGAQVLFTKSGGWIISPTATVQIDGSTPPFKRVNDTYCREVSIDKPVFNRPRPVAS